MMRWSRFVSLVVTGWTVPFIQDGRSELAHDTEIFDRKAVRQHRSRAAAIEGDYDFLHHRVARDMCDRLADVNRRFRTALDLGVGFGSPPPSDRIADRIGMDLSPGPAAS